MKPSELVGRIFDIQRFCVSDGPGIRTTVFFQGCPLHCPWCHNPESRPFAPRLLFHAEKCIRCGRCVVPAAGDRCVRRPDETCDGCGVCVNECPAGALTLLGKAVTAEDVLEVVRRDRFFYREHNGGMTLSGGEPLAQVDFAADLLCRAKTEGLHCAVETSGAIPQAHLKKVLPLVDLFLFDIKCVWKKYRELIGVNPDLIRSNLEMLSTKGARIILRTPLVEGYNREPALLEQLVELKALPGVEGVELLPYHDMGKGKAAMAGLPEADWKTMSRPSEEVFAQWRERLA